MTVKVIDLYEDEEGVKDDMDVEEPNLGFNPEWMARVDR